MEEERISRDHLQSVGFVRLKKVGLLFVVLTVFSIPIFSEAHIKIFGTSLVNVLVFICLLIMMIDIALHLRVSVLFLFITLIICWGVLGYWLSGLGTQFLTLRDNEMLFVYLTRGVFLMVFIWFVRYYPDLTFVKKALINSSFVVVLVSILRWLGLSFGGYYVSYEYGVTDRIFGTFIISGSYSIWLGMAFVFILYEMLFCSISMGRMIYYLLLAGLIPISAILIAHSRNLMLFCFVAFTILTWKRLNPRGVYRILSGVFFIVMLLLLAFYIGVSVVNGEIVLTARVTLIKAAWPYITEYWMHGLGMGVFRDLISPRAQPVHNFFLDVLVDAGIFCLISYISLFLLLVVLYRKIKKIRASTPIMVVVVATFLSIQFFPAELSFPFWFSIAFCFSYMRALQERYLRIPDRVSVNPSCMTNLLSTHSD